MWEAVLVSLNFQVLSCLKMYHLSFKKSEKCSFIGPSINDVQFSVFMFLHECRFCLEFNYSLQFCAQHFILKNEVSNSVLQSDDLSLAERSQPTAGTEQRPSGWSRTFSPPWQDRANSTYIKPSASGARLNLQGE